MRLHVDVVCRSCDGEVELVTVGRVLLGETSTIVRCVVCGFEWQLWLQMLAVSGIEGGVRRVPNSHMVAS